MSISARSARGLGIALLLSMWLPMDGWAQSCNTLVPVQNPSFAGGTNSSPLNLPPYWAVTTTVLGSQAVNGWVYADANAYISGDFAPNTVAGRAVRTTGYNTLQQTVQGGVGGGSVIQFQLRWINGNGVVGGGNTAELGVYYAGVLYATFFTTPYAAVNYTKPTPTATGGAVIATSPAWSSFPDVTVAPGLDYSTVSITLPAGVPASGQLVFVARRNQPAGTLDPGSQTDDYQVFNPQILSPTLCLLKQSNVASGSFAFTVGNADTDLGTTGTQTAATITTTSPGVPVAFDAWPDNAASGFDASAGVEPLLVTDPALAVSVVESPAQDPGFRLAQANCSGGGTATVDTATNTATITGITAAAAPTICTLVNDYFVDMAIEKTSNPPGPVTPGTALQYTLQITNNGPGSVTGTVVTDTPDTGLDCPASNPVAITGDGIPAGGPYTIANLTGAGIVMGTLAATQSASLTYTCTVE
ncbi:hypothetical protein ABB29_02165 [Pseudoxanthomonas dokdonensis]|uniref:DUF11 domain-containing protein n=2 Tax=Pseudoxanthomonas dokdonensis TaxID=344882 RepID=A0A0R0CQF7_9GAMM|nr:hypothetical protein ABB29_02165 [Pseudoxanthomonas dokdonensis]